MVHRDLAEFSFVIALVFMQMLSQKCGGGCFMTFFFYFFELVPFLALFGVIFSGTD